MVTNQEKERLSRLYEKNGWAGKTDAGRKILIHKFFMKGSEFPEWELVKSIPEQSFQDSKVLTYLWKKTEAKENSLIRIDVIESDSWSSAQEVLLAMLADYQIPQLSEAKSRNIELGDIGFIAPGDTMGSAIFSRANMVIGIHSVGKRDISVVDMAKHIDNLFCIKPEVSEKGIIPEIEDFVSERDVIKRDEIIALDIKAKDPLDRPLWYRFEVDQGELSVKDEKVCFSSKAPGQPKISLFAVNENGFVAGATLSVKIEKGK